ncbi:hypothetical protein ACOSQ2_026337 [Xanthoceras sorbifolium]
MVRSLVLAIEGLNWIFGCLEMGRGVFLIITVFYFFGLWVLDFCLLVTGDVGILSSAPLEYLLFCGVLRSIPLIWCYYWIYYAWFAILSSPHSLLNYKLRFFMTRE